MKARLLFKDGIYVDGDLLIEGRCRMNSVARSVYFWAWRFIPSFQNESSDGVFSTASKIYSPHESFSTQHEALEDFKQYGEIIE